MSKEEELLQQRMRAMASGVTSYVWVECSTSWASLKVTAGSLRSGAVRLHVLTGSVLTL